MQQRHDYYEEETPVYTVSFNNKPTPDTRTHTRYIPPGFTHAHTTATTTTSSAPSALQRSSASGALLPRPPQYPRRQRAGPG
eukprot:14372-Eustigmatos_ZCMA.PRE.1